MGIILFFIVFSTVYSLMNWLVYSQVAWALKASGVLRLGLAAIFFSMVISLAISSILGDRSGTWAMVNYLWFGFIFYLFLSSLIVVILRLLGLGVAARPLLFVLLFVSAGLCAWGIYEARDIKVRKIEVASSRMALDQKPLRIALISDVHIHSVEGMGRLQRVLNTLKPLDYDLLVSAGDLIESGIHKTDWQKTANVLRDIKPPLGKVAVQGNHEIYANLSAQDDISAKYHKHSGFELLNNRVLKLKGLQIVGIDDPQSPKKPANGTREIDLLKNLDSDKPVLLIKHRPIVRKQSLGLFDVMVAGHTHGGQMWPFNYAVKAVFPYLRGRFDLPKKSVLFTSTGAGTWGPPMRVGPHPEVVLITIKPETRSEKN